MPEPAIPEYRQLAIAEIGVARAMRAAMVRELDGRDPDDDYPTWRDRYEEFYAPKMAEDRAALFVAELSGRAVGVAAVYLLRNHRSDIFARQSAYVSNVWVD